MKSIGPKAHTMIFFEKWS